MQQFNLRKAGLLVIALMTIILTGTLTTTAQVTVNPGGGSYTTVNAAFAAINAGTHTGAVTIAISGNTTEPAAPTVLAASGVGGANYSSVTIYPTAANVVVSGTSNASTGVLVFNGADNVTINGNINNGTGTSRNLTIRNNIASTSGHTVLWFQGSSTSPQLGCTGITVKNTILMGNGNPSGTSATSPYSSTIIFSSTSFPTSTSITGLNHSNVTITNNEIMKVSTGIHIGNTSTSQMTGLNISNNEIGSSNPSDYVYYRGIWISNTTGSIIRQNHIFNIKTGTNMTLDKTGIEIAGTGSTAALVDRNHIHGLENYSTSGYAGYGINLNGGTGHTVLNNLVYDISGFGEAIQANTPTGIRVSSGTGHGIYYNTVNLYGQITRTGTGYSAAFSVASTAVNNIIVKNNIFSNKTTNPNSTTSEHMAIWFVASYNFGTANNDFNTNGLYVTPSSINHFVAKVGTTVGTNTYPDLLAWQTLSGGDINSVPLVSMNAPFTSNTNLTIPAGTTTGLESNGTVIASLGLPNIDYTGISRPAGTGTGPDIGAYEFAGVPPSGCSTTPTPGTASINITSICNGSNIELSLTGFTIDFGIEIQWQQSANAGGPFTNISGATDPTYTSGALSATTHYRARVRCVNGNLDAFSNVVSVTVENPAVSSTVPGSRCGVGTVTLSATAPGYTLNWYENPTGGTALGSGNSFTTPVISNTTTYYVAASTAGGTQTIPGDGDWDHVTTTGAFQTTSITSAYMILTVLQPITLQSMDIYPAAAIGTSFNIDVRTGSASGPSYTNYAGVTTVQNSGTPSVAQTVPVNFSLQPGTYYIGFTSNPNTWRSGSVTHSFPWTIPGVVSLDYYLSPSYQYYFYNLQLIAGCEGSRVPVVATVNAPPSVSTNITSAEICNGTTLNLSVSSSNANYTYTWNPGNISGSSITVNPTANTTYIVSAIDNSGGTFNGCANSDTVEVVVFPASATITTTAGDICVSGSKVLTLSPAGAFPTGSIQWQSSPNGVTWTNISGATSETYTTPTLTATTHYKAVISNSSSQVCLEPTIIIVVNNPQVLSTTPGTRCGVGTVNLSATASAGATLNWFDAPSGGSAIGTGNNFTTPVISTTTDFYVSALYGAGGAGSVGAPFSDGANGTYTLEAGLFFNADVPFTIETVHIYPVGTGAGTVDIALRDPSGTILQTYTYNGNGLATPSVKTPVNVNFNVPAPGTGYSLVMLQRTGSISGLIRDNSANIQGSFPFSLPGVMTITSGRCCPSATSTSYYYFYDWQVSAGCESPRVPVTATVTTSPAINATSNLTVACNGAPVNLSVTSTNPNYVYTWTPGNITGANITVNPTATTTYTVNAQDNAGCANVADVEVTVLPASATISANNSAAICVSGSRVLSLSPAGVYGTAQIQWQESANGITYTNISGATGESYTTPSLNSTMYYRAQVFNSAGVVCLQPTYTVSVNNPQILTSNGATVCGAGSATLTATSTAGSNVTWYDAATGGNVVGTGNSYTTPLINSTTNYYAAAVTGGGTESAARPTYTGTANTNGNNWGLVFNVNNTDVTIQSVDIYSVGTGGTISVQLQNSSGVVLATAGPFTYGPGSTANPTVVTLPVNFNVPVGTGYRMLSTAMSGGNVIRETTGISGTWPYVSTSGNVSVTSGYISGTTLSTYYWFYNWQVSAGCESPRTMVTATVTPSPFPVTASSAMSTVCEGSSTTITASSSNPNYTYSWTSNPAGFTASGPGPHTVTPNGQTTYEVFAFDSNDNCASLSSVTINTTVNNLLLSATSTPADVCYGADAQLNASASVPTAVASYSFSQSNGVYSPITGSLIAEATGTTTSNVNSLDQGNWSANIGFPFTFAGSSYTSVNINANGYVTFGTTLPSVGLTTPISSTTAYNGVVSAMARDIWGVYGSIGTRTSGSAVITGVTDFTGIAVGKNLRGTGIPTTATVVAFNPGAGTITMSTTATSTSTATWFGWPVGEIRTATIGTAPNRTFVVQYSGFSDFVTSGANGNWMDFQIRLHEGGGSGVQPVSIVYGPMTNLLSTSRTNQVGLRGATNSDYNNRTSTTDWSATTDGTANSSTVTRTNTIFPASGLTFTWTPPTPPNFSYAWSPSYNLTDASIANPVAQAMTAGETYSVLVTDVNTGCEITETVTVNVNPVPFPAFSANAPAVCEGSQIDLYALDGDQYTYSGPGFGPITLPGDPFSGSTINVTFNAQSGVHDGNYSVTVTNSYGCTATETIYVGVNPLPQLSIVNIVPESCPGAMDGSFVLSSSGSPDFTYYLTSGDQNGGGIFELLGAGDYFAYVSDANCFNFTPIQVTVPLTPNVPPTLTCVGDVNTVNDPGVCGATVTYADPVAFDTCPTGLTSVVQTNGLPSGSVFPVGTTVNTFVVYDAEGDSATCSFSVTVADTEDPAFTGVPSNFSACNPVSWTAPVATDNCSSGNSLVVTSNYEPGDIFPSGTTTVTYTATDAYGNQTVVSFNVTLLEASVAADSISSNRDYNNICAGESITLTINGGSLGDQASWKWYANGCGSGASIGTGTTLTVAPMTTTTYYARAEGFCNNTACVQIQVVVSAAAPTGPVTYNVLPAFGAPGVTDVISVNPVPNATYYRWFTTNGQINSVLFNNTISPVQTTIPSVNLTYVLPLQNYQIRVLAGNACGRTNTANTHIRGTVEAPTSLTGPTEVCPGSVHQYTVSAIPSQSGGSQVSYNWYLVPSNAGTISGSGLTRTVTFAPGFTSAQLCVNGISSFGLAGPALCITITTAAPAPSAVNGSNLVCADGSTVVTYTATPVPTAISYNWTVPAGATISGAANGSSINVIFGPSFTGGNVCVAAVTASCGTSSYTCMTVDANEVGDPGVIVGPSTGVCGESNVSYSLSNGGANTYNWTLPAGASFNGPANGSAISVDFGAGFTSGYITVQAVFACGSVTRDIFVNGAPAMPTVNPATICPNSTEVYVASSAGATSYNWTVNGANSYAVNFSTEEMTAEWGPSNNNFTVTAANACGTSDLFVLNQNCRLAGSGNMGQVNVFPNPTSGEINVEFTSETNTRINITVKDLAGRTVFASDFKAVSGFNKAEVDLSFVNKGLYILHLQDQGGNTSVTKVTVE